MITIKLKKTSSISGRLVDERRQPLAGQLVEIWSNRQGVRLLPSLVGFKQGPVRTDADGSFCTPANLLQGSAYRVAIRRPAKTRSFPIGSRSRTSRITWARWFSERCGRFVGPCSTGRAIRFLGPGSSRQVTDRNAPRPPRTRTAFLRWAGFGTDLCFSSSAAPAFGSTASWSSRAT